MGRIGVSQEEKERIWKLFSKSNVRKAIIARRMGYSRTTITNVIREMEDENDDILLTNDIEEDECYECGATASGCQCQR